MGTDRVNAEVLFLIGRLMAALMYLLLGISHFVQLPGLIDYAESRRVPLPLLTVPLTGLALIAGALSIGLGLYPRAGVIIVAAFLLLAALVAHRPSPQDDEREWHRETFNFMRNMALAGTTLMLLATPEWPYALTP